MIESGEYKLPMIKTVLPRGGMQVVTFAIWELGLATAHGNPKNIKDIAHWAAVIGYDHIGSGHLAGALDVTGQADCC